MSDAIGGAVEASAEIEKVHLPMSISEHPSISHQPTEMDECLGIADKPPGIGGLPRTDKTRSFALRDC